MPLEIDYRPIKLPSAPSEGEIRARGAHQRPGTIGMSTSPQQAPRTRHWHRAIAVAALLCIVATLIAVLGWGDRFGMHPTSESHREVVATTAGTEATSGLLNPVAARAAWDRTLAGAPPDSSNAHSVAVSASPAARPTVPTGSGLDRARALQCMTAAIYYEAAREPDEGQRAVAQVVLNRVAHPAFPKTVCGVVYQGSERAGCQFSFACDGSMARAPMAAYWARARRVAESALAGYVFAPVGLATHYHTSAVHPGWADTMSFLGMIGAHRFYRWSGSAGQPHAFNAVYAGGEPVAAPHPRSWISTGADFADPMILEKAFEAGRLAALRAASANPAATPPDLTTGRAGIAGNPQPGPQTTTPDPGSRNRILPGSGAVRPDAEQQYDNAAHWIRQPGT